MKKEYQTMETTVYSVEARSLLVGSGEFGDVPAPGDL